MRMTTGRTILAGAFIYLTLTASAEVWDLRKCVDYAVGHNLTVKGRGIDVKRSEQGVAEAEDRFLPRLDASASQNFNFGRGLTSDNTYADRNTGQFQWGVSMSLPLFQGLSEYRQLRLAKSTLTRTLLEYEAAKDDLTLNIISQYLQVLYCREVQKSAESQAGYSAYEVGRQKALVESGKVAEADLYDAEAQASQDRLQVVQASNDTQTALVNLANLLQLPSAKGFDVADIQEGEPLIGNAGEIFEDALRSNNSIKGARQSLQVADDNISLAKSGYLPTLSFNAGIGSSYYKVNGFDNEKIGRQMRHNFSTFLGFSLNIPVFDGFTTRNGIRNAKLQKLEAELELEQREEDLRKEIQLAWYQAKGARERWLASKETLEKTRLSFEATREKYSLGRATPTEFEQAKNNLFRTDINRIQAYYEYILRNRILQFYRNQEI